MRILLVTGLLLAISLHATAGMFQADSVGVEEENGKKFVLHKVEQKETLYSLSRRYNVSVQQIIDSNPQAEQGLNIGQIIRVPRNAAEYPSPSYVSVDEKIHVVKPKETIFSISKMYDVSIDDLKRWNNLTNNLLEIDQRLVIKEKIDNTATGQGKEEKSGDRKTHIVQSGETLYSISKSYGVSIEEIRSWNELIGNEISIGQELAVSKRTPDSSPSETEFSKNEGTTLADPAENPAVNDKPATRDLSASKDANTTTPVETPPLNERQPLKTSGTSSTTFEEVQEAGIAELIEGSENTRKYLALHKTAKPGTIMKVRNDMNGQEVFVRVMGKLPDTGLNDKVLIKISKSAYDRLGAIDPRFRVSVSYIP